MFNTSTHVETLPAVPAHALTPVVTIENPAHEDDSNNNNNSTNNNSSNNNDDGLSRSASYTSLPGVAGNGAPGFKRTFSENVLNTLVQDPTKVTPSMQSANLEMFRRASQKTKKRMSVAGFVSVTDINETDQGKRAEIASTRQTKGGSSMFKIFTKKPVLPPNSQVSSPSQREQDQLQGEKKKNTSPTRSSTRSSRSIARPEPVARRASPRSSIQADDLITRNSRGGDDVQSIRSGISPAPTSRTQSENSFEMDSEIASSKRLSRRSSFSSLRSRASTDRMFLSVPQKVPPVPSISPDRLSYLSSEAAKRKDPQWTVFRQIDGEQASFGAKTGLQKAKTIRTVLLPFFHKNNDHSALHLLRAEDLDRRTIILHKWWTCLLELLSGPQQQSVSSTDRPAFLDAINEIMLRPEWRVPSVQVSAVDALKNRESMAKTESNSSTDGDDPEFVTASVHQNVRNVFVQDLLQQMAYVVDKLSMRNAPASLVSFAGKTCAYAFFFCPGVADLLTRLWHIPPGTLRRIFAEYGPENSRSAAALSHALAASFPLPMRSLAFTSHAVLARQLQRKVQTPPGTAHICWYGPWINRWIGRDSDLFFVFVKHYHILVTEHLPRSLMPEERLSVPGLVIVHAQLMLNLESTLYRQAGHFAAETYAGDNPDSVAPMPMVVPNATRSICENRIVMMIREISNDPRPKYQNVAELLVGSFQFILKAATRKISMYNNDACFVLCDLLEELLPIVSKFQQIHREAEDWGFWFKVFQQLMQSQTTMTRIRVIAFLYSMWTILILNEERKRQMVLNWILEPNFFNQHFNHWSPMVRHYFYRLLCWRVGRCDGLATETDLEIYQALQRRLYTCYAHHAYLTADAEMRDISPPSVHPCSPAPGRTLLIIRTDSGPGRNSSFTSFDRLMTQSNNSTAYITSSAMLGKIPENDVQPNTKKRWSLLKTISLFSGPTNTKPGEVTPPRSPTMNPADSKSTSTDAKKSNNKSNPSSASSGPISRPTTPPHQALSFRFSLEHSNTRPQLHNKPKRLPTPTIPHTAQRILDELDALSRVSLSNSSNSSSSSSGSLPSPSPRTPTSVHSHPVHPNHHVAHPNHQAHSTMSVNKCLLPMQYREIDPLKPKPEEMSTARYSGRALSEWAQVILECRNFYTRRKQEGVPGDKSVETPVMAVETFRMFG